MSNVKISALPTGTVASTDLVPVVKAGVTTAVTFGHTHPQSDVTGLTTDLAGKAASSHTHSESDVTSLVSDLAAKALQSDMTTAQSDITSLQSSRTTDEAAIVVLQNKTSNMQQLASLDQSGWAWLNQGAATVSQGSGAVRLELANDSTEQVRGRFVAAPSTPYTITALIYPGPLNTTGLCGVGIGFRNTVSGRLAYVAYVGNSAGAGPKFMVRKNTSATANSSATNSSPFISPSAPVYVRIADDGTNLTWSYSFDGVNFTTLVTETRGTFFTGGNTPDQVGIVIQNFGSNITIGGSIMSWVQA